MTTTRKKRKKKSIFRSTFYRVYFALVILALIAIVGGTVWLNGALKDYESSQPKYAAQPVGQLFESRDFDRLYALDTSAAEISGGDREFYIESMRALTEGKRVEWTETFTGNADERRYNVKLDGEKFATFTLVPSGRTTGHGNPLWQLGSVTTHIEVRQPEPTLSPEAAACRVTAPQGCAVTVDGRALTEADILSTEPLLPADFLPEGSAGPMMVTYGFAPAGDQPAISVADASGEALAVEAEGENTWLCKPGEDAALRESYQDAIVKLGERIAKYTAKDLSQSALLSGVADDSPAETVIKKFSNSWAPTHKTSKIVNPVVSDFYAISEDCFTCHVEFDFVLTSRRGNDYTYPTAYTFCVVRRKGEGRLYNLMFH